MSPISNAIKLAAMNVKSQTHKIDGKTYLFKTKLTADEAEKKVAEKKYISLNELYELADTASPGGDQYTVEKTNRVWNKVWGKKLLSVSSAEDQKGFRAYFLARKVYLINIMEIVILFILTIQKKLSLK